MRMTFFSDFAKIEPFFNFETKSSPFLSSLPFTEFQNDNFYVLFRHKHVET